MKTEEIMFTPPRKICINRIDAAETERLGRHLSRAISACEPGYVEYTAIDQLWHNPEEIFPSVNANILFTTNADTGKVLAGTFIISFELDDEPVYRFRDNATADYSEAEYRPEDVQQWAYTEDLLPSHCAMKGDRQ